MRAFAGDALGHHLGQLEVAGQRLLDRVGDPNGAAALVGVEIELTRHRDRVEREAVGRGVDLGVDDVGTGHGAGTGDDR